MTASNAITVVRPAGSVAGDVLVGCLALSGSSVARSGVPAGWTPLATITAVTNPRVFGYYKVTGVMEPLDYRWTLNGSVVSAAGIARYALLRRQHALATGRRGEHRRRRCGHVRDRARRHEGERECAAGPDAWHQLLLGDRTITSPSGMGEAWDVGGRRHEFAGGLQAMAGGSGAKQWTFSSDRA